MDEETFAFRGLGKFIALGTGVGLLQVGTGLVSLREALRDKSVVRGFTAVAVATSGLALIGAFLSCFDAGIRVGDDGVEVRLGRLWRKTIPYSAIATAVPVDFPITNGIGVRTNLRGTVTVVPWGTRAVELDLSPPMDLPVIFLTEHGARRLLLGVQDRERFVSAVMQRVLGPVTAV